MSNPWFDLLLFCGSAAAECQFNSEMLTMELQDVLMNWSNLYSCSHQKMSRICQMLLNLSNPCTVSIWNDHVSHFTKAELQFLPKASVKSIHISTPDSSQVHRSPLSSQNLPFRLHFHLRLVITSDMTDSAVSLSLNRTCSGLKHLNSTTVFVKLPCSHAEAGNLFTNSWTLKKKNMEVTSVICYIEEFFHTTQEGKVQIDRRDFIVTAGSLGSFTKGHVSNTLIWFP